MFSEALLFIPAVSKLEPTDLGSKYKLPFGVSHPAERCQSDGAQCHEGQKGEVSAEERWRMNKNITAFSRTDEAPGYGDAS